MQFGSNQYLFHKDSNLGLASFSAFAYLCIKRIYPLQTIQFVRCGSVLFRYLFDRNNVIPEPKQEEAPSSGCKLFIAERLRSR